MRTKKVTEFLDDLCAALGRDPGSLNLTDARADVPEWDSIGHLGILSAIDAELEVPVDDPDIRSFDTIGGLVDKLKGLGALED
jgi:acyl carrier protein